MKRHLLVILSILTIIPTFAKDEEVIMTKQITQNQRDIIPDKTDELKLQNLEIDTVGNYQTLWKLILASCKEEYEYRCMKLDVKETNELLSFTLSGYDPMKEEKEGREKLGGAIKNGYFYIIVDKLTSGNHLKKAKGKTKFIREFELVEEPRTNDETIIEGTITKGSVKLEKMVIDGEDKLAPPDSAEPAQIDTQETNQQEQQINITL